jgi:hypothetical protein
VNNCRTGDGGGAGLHVDSGTQFEGGQGLIVRGNTVDEPYCRHAAYVTHRDHVRISGNVFRKGSSLGTLYLSNASDVTVEDGLIDGEGRVSAGIFLRGDVSGLTVRGDLVVTGYTQEKVIVSDPTTVTNVVVE